MKKTIWLRLVAVVALYGTFGVYCTHVELDDYWFLSSQVLSKEQVANNGDCTDADGNVYSHLQNWTEANECATFTCFQASTANFIIKSSCRQPLQAENPDTTNCVFNADNSYAYPHCCPVLDCPEGQQSLLTTTASPACTDRASNSSCFIWNEMDGCNSASVLYNITSNYCRQTCAFC